MIPKDVETRQLDLTTANEEEIMAAVRGLQVYM
jgi:hypothetical protein